MAQDPVLLDDLVAHVVAKTSGASALDQLTIAVETASHLGEVSDHLVGHFVDHARKEGASWTEIGTFMGVSKQAAQKRFVPRESEDLDFPRTGRLSRFTKRAHHVLQVAKSEASSRGSGEVGNEHLLLGLLSEPDGLAARAIVAAGISLEHVERAATAMLKPGGTSRVRRTSYGRATKKTIELALREALHLNHNYIGTEHLLLGLLRNDGERAAQVLISLGITRSSVETWVKEELDRI